MENAKNKRSLFLLTAVLLAGLLLALVGWWLMQNNTTGTAYKIGDEVTVSGTVSGVERTEHIADDPDVLTVELDNGKTIKTYSYCGYTSIEYVGDIDSSIEPGDKIRIFGKVTDNNFIDVCNTRYSIHKI